MCRLSVPGVVLLECPAWPGHRMGATPSVWPLRGCQQASVGAESGPKVAVFILGIPCFIRAPSLTVVWEPDGDLLWLGDHNLPCLFVSVVHT